MAVSSLKAIISGRLFSLKQCKELLCAFHSFGANYLKCVFLWVCRLAAKHLVVVVVKRPETGRASLTCSRRLPPNGVLPLFASGNFSAWDLGIKIWVFTFTERWTWDKMALPNFRQTSSPGPMGGRKFCFAIKSQIKHSLDFFFWCRCAAWINYSPMVKQKIKNT